MMHATLLITRLLVQAPPPAGGGEVTMTPSNTDLMGGDLWQRLIDWLGWGGLMASLGAVLVGGGSWGWGQWQGHTMMASRGKVFALGGVAGAIVVGLAPTAINTMYRLASG